MSDGKPRLIQDGPYFAQLWESVLFDERLNPSAIVVYATLQRYAAEFGKHSVFPSQQTIADRIGLSRETVNACLKMLVDCGHISRTRTENGFVIRINEPQKRVEKVHKGVENSDNPVEKIHTRVENSDTIREIQSTTEITEVPPIVPQGTKTKRKTSMSQDWVPSDRALAWALEQGHTEASIRYEVDQFRDHYLGKGEGRADWEASWRTWMRNAQKWAKPSNGKAKTDYREVAQRLREAGL